MSREGVGLGGDFMYGDVPCLGKGAPYGEVQCIMGNGHMEPFSPRAG